MVGILSSGHQLLLCLEVEHFLVEKSSPIFIKILLPLCSVDVRRKAANFHLRVCYRSVIRHCDMSRHSLFCDITRCISVFDWLPALQYATYSQSHEPHGDLLSQQPERDNSSKFSYLNISFSVGNCANKDLDVFTHYYRPFVAEHYKNGLFIIQTNKCTTCILIVHYIP